MDNSTKLAALLEQMSQEQRSEFSTHIHEAYKLLEQTFGADNFSKWLDYFCDDEAIVALFCIDSLSSEIWFKHRNDNND